MVMARLALTHTDLDGDPVLLRALAPRLSLDPGPLDAEVRRRARRAWEDRTRSEYVGVFVMRRFHGLLVDLGAPLELQELGLVLTLHEQVHAGWCLAAARSLGSTGDLDFEVQALQQARSDAELSTQLVEMLVGTFAVGEVVAGGLLRHTLGALSDSPYRDLLVRIAKDEVLHARIGPVLLAALRAGQLPWLDDPGPAFIEATFARYRAAMARRDVVENEDLALAPDSAINRGLLALGVPPAAAFKAAYFESLERDVEKAKRRAMGDGGETKWK